MCAPQMGQSLSRTPDNTSLYPQQDFHNFCRTFSIDSFCRTRAVLLYGRRSRNGVVMEIMRGDVSAGFHSTVNSLTKIRTNSVSFARSSSVKALYFVQTMLGSRNSAASNPCSCVRECSHLLRQSREYPKTS